MRAFIALTLPQETRDALERVQRALALPRPVDPDALHLTLAFLDDQPAPVLEDLHFALETLTAAMLDLTLAGLGSFGTPARQIHATLAPDARLDALQARVARAARGVGIALDRRRFVPHVTLARAPIPHGPLAQNLARASALLPVAFPAREVALMSSHLHRLGPQYDTLARYPLTLASHAPSG